MAEFTLLEPMSIGDVIDRAVRLYRRNFASLISVVALPCVVGYAAALMFWYGYSKLVLGLASGPSPDAVAALGVSLLLYPAYSFLLLTVVSGLARVVGDSIMLGERITFRGWFKAARMRLGSIALMWFLMLVLIMVLYVVFAVVAFALIMLVAVVAGVTAKAGLPPWLMGTITGIGVLALIAGGLFTLLFVLARVVFIPQVVMVEGESAASALGRAIRLGGGGNWHKLGAIVLFTYFITFSIQLALVVPFGLALYLSGFLTAEFFISPMWNAIYGAFGQVSNMLALPIWIVSLTLLYFDSRVRKEGYDVELVAREIAPGFVWRPVPAQSPGVSDAAVAGGGWHASQDQREGLAHQAAHAAPAPDRRITPELSPAVAAAFGISQQSDLAEAAHLRRSVPYEQRAEEIIHKLCHGCGSRLEPGALFCHICGANAIDSRPPSIVQ